jgi:hypothetical protein
VARTWSLKTSPQLPKLWLLVILWNHGVKLPFFFGREEWRKTLPLVSRLPDEAGNGPRTRLDERTHISPIPQNRFFPGAAPGDSAPPSVSSPVRVGIGV